MCSQSQATETGNTEDNQLENPPSEEDEPGGSLVIERIEHIGIGILLIDLLMSRSQTPQFNRPNPVIDNAAPCRQLLIQAHYRRMKPLKDCDTADVTAVQVHRQSPGTALP